MEVGTTHGTMAIPAGMTLGTTATPAYMAGMEAGTEVGTEVGMTHGTGTCRQITADGMEDGTLTGTTITTTRTMESPEVEKMSGMVPENQSPEAGPAQEELPQAAHPLDAPAPAG